MKLGPGIGFTIHRKNNLSVSPYWCCIVTSHFIATIDLRYRSILALCGNRSHTIMHLTRQTKIQWGIHLRQRTSLCCKNSSRYKDLALATQIMFLKCILFEFSLRLSLIVRWGFCLFECLFGVCLFVCWGVCLFVVVNSFSVGDFGMLFVYYCPVVVSMRMLTRTSDTLLLFSYLVTLCSRKQHGKHTCRSPSLGR